MQLVAEMPEDERVQFFVSVLRGQDISPDEFAYQLRTEPRWLLRREQFPPPGEWWLWLLRAGRGFGKTRAGASWLIDQAAFRELPGTAIIGATGTDLARFCLKGPSGVLSIAPDDRRPEHRKGDDARLVWDAPGAAPYAGRLETLLFSAERPDRLRGPNLSRLWCDELASWQYLDECWDNIEFSLREGTDPRVVVTTTPKPLRLIKELQRRSGVVVTTGSTYDNIEHLAPKFVRRIRERYEGTSLGRQELHGEIIDEAEGALWKREWLDGLRVRAAAELRRVGIGVDPAATSRESSDETGIVEGAVGEDGHFYALGDLSGRYKPKGWAEKAVLAYHARGANAIVAERNNGGEMVLETVENAARELHRRRVVPTPHVKCVMVWASHGKAARAEPISLLYEQGRAHHVGSFNELEDEMTGWEPGSGKRSPSRLDALVWVATWLTQDKVEDWDPREAFTVPLAGAASFADRPWSTGYDPYDM